MLYEEKIYEGMSVKLVFREGDYQGSYRTLITEVGTRILSVAIPIVGGKYITLRVGTPLEVLFNDELTAYSFKSCIIDRFPRPVPTYIIEFPQQIEKVQRRKFVRIPLHDPIKYRVLDKIGISSEKSGLMQDLSGGGVLFDTEENLPNNSLILVKLRIESEIIEVPAIVIRSEQVHNRKMFAVSAEFRDISEKIRDEIIRYVFKIQIERRKKV